MGLNTFIPLLIKELGSKNPNALDTNTPGVYSLPAGENLTVILSDIDNGFMLNCHIAPFPKENAEELLVEVMYGNLFGRETSNAILSLSNDTNELTLTQVVDYQLDYSSFKNILEEFLNTIDFWHGELATKSKK